MNELALKARLRSIRRLLPLASALLLAALVAIPSSGIALAQTPGLSLVNEDEDFIERKGDGRFIARLLFSREIEVLYYGVRDADTGDWVSAVYRVSGGEKERSDGWEYSWEYPDLDEQPLPGPGPGLPAGQLGALALRSHPPPDAQGPGSNRVPRPIQIGGER